MIDLFKNFYNIIKSPHFYVPLIVIIFLLIIIYILGKTFHNRIRVIFFKIGNSEFDLWSLSHVLLYMYFGYYFPNFFIEFLIIGSLWELFESTSFCSKPFLKFINCQMPGVTDNIVAGSDNIICKTIKKVQNCDYWYGKLEDIPLNMIGFVIGACLSKYKHK
jgi:hypothetical protein